MQKKFLKELNIEGMTDEIIDKIMDENGKDAEKLKKQIESMTAETESLRNSYGEIETKLKQFALPDGQYVNIDDLKSRVAALTGEIEANKQAYEAERAKDKRLNETNEFLSGYKFVNEYTKKAFADSLNAALEDKTNEGRNRKDIFDTLVKGEDGKPLENIFADIVADAASRNVLSIDKALPPSGGAPKTTAGATIPLMFQPVRPVPNTVNIPAQPAQI